MRRTNRDRLESTREKGRVCKKKKKKEVLNKSHKLSCVLGVTEGQSLGGAAVGSPSHRSGFKKWNHTEDITLLARPGFNGFIKVCNRSGWPLFPLDLQLTGVGASLFARST